LNIIEREEEKEEEEEEERKRNILHKLQINKNRSR